MSIPVWPEKSEHDTRTSEEWAKYCSEPFNSERGHTEYAAELSKIAVSYKEYI